MDDFLNGDAAFRHLFFSLRDYAVILLNEEGNVAVWNEGASQLTGYRAEEIVGCHFSMLHTSEDRAIGHPERQLIAASAGRYEEEGWRVRKDGTRFWAHTVLVALHDDAHRLRGFGEIMQDSTEHKQATEQSANVTRLLEHTARTDYLTGLDNRDLTPVSHPAITRVLC